MNSRRIKSIYSGVSSFTILFRDGRLIIEPDGLLDIAKLDIRASVTPYVGADIIRRFVAPSSLISTETISSRKVL